MPSKIAQLIDTDSEAEVGKMKYSCFFLLERIRHRFLLFPRITVSLLLPQEMLLCLMLLLYIINALEVGVLMCLHLITQAYVAQFYAWLFFCLSFLASPVAPQLRFLGQAHVGPKRSTNKEIYKLKCQSS
jgi:hypothetical protein